MMINSNPHHHRAGFSMVELAIGISIVAILLGALLPVIALVRAQARTAECQDNLNQIGLALKMADETNSMPILASNWIDEASPFLEDASAISCPSDIQFRSTSYGVNNQFNHLEGGDGRKIVALDYSKKVAEIVVSNVDQQDIWNYELPLRHLKSVNVLFYDGSVSRRDPVEIDPRYCSEFYAYWRPVRDTNVWLTGCKEVDGSTSSESEQQKSNSRAVAQND
ncbi:MAG: type II secretion system GspH family protein [Planctomycetales bacterium]